MINLPYKLKEGQIAYARHVMANFNALINALSGLDLTGVSATELTEILQELANNKVTANSTGNASQIVFSDGDTMEQKIAELNNVCYAGFGKFSVDTDGNLQVTVTTEENPFSINADGELIYTVPSTTTENNTTFNLGSVRGTTGATGPAGASTNYTATVYAADNTGVNTAAWDKRSTITVEGTATDNTGFLKAVISCEGITESNNFLVQPAPSASAAAYSAWLKASPRVVAQANGNFTLEAKALSALPEVDIPLAITVNI